jgi:hypothetical protein
MRVGIIWGIILGAAVCVWTLAIHSLGFYTTRIQAGQYADIAVTVLPIATMWMALRQRRHLEKRPLRIWESLVTGIAVGGTSALITAGFLWWYHHFLNPQWNELLIAWRRSTMTAAGVASEEISRVVESLRASGTDRAQFTGAIVGSIALSAILSLIMGLYFRWSKASDSAR